MGVKVNPQVSITLTPAQRAAVEAAFAQMPEAERPTISEMVRELVASGLALHQIQWPPDTMRGGWRGGRKSRPR